MMRHLLLPALVLLLLALAACKKEEKSLPITEEKLIPLLVDVHLVEAQIQDQYGPPKDSLARLYYEKVYRLHGVTAADFDSTMAVLRRNPVRLDRIYEKVLEGLSVREAGVQ